MTTNSFLVTYLLTALVAAVLGGVAMELVMWIIAKAGLAKGDMILALGSLLTKRRENAYRVGFIVHTSAALGFALLYTLLLVTLHVSDMPQSMMLGLGVGVLQGIIVSLMLIWIVAEQHPRVFAELVSAYGHRFLFTSGQRPASSYTMSMYLARTLGQLARTGAVELRIDQATGYWSYNSSISWWAMPPAQDWSGRLSFADSGLAVTYVTLEA